MIDSDITVERLQEIFDSIESGIALCSSLKGNFARNLFFDWRARKFIVERYNEATGETSTTRVDTVAEAADAYNGTGAHTLGARNV